MAYWKYQRNADGKYTPLVIKSYLSNARFVLFKLFDYLYKIFLMGHVTLKKKYVEGWQYDYTLQSKAITYL